MWDGCGSGVLEVSLRCGDNLPLLREMADESVDLVYADPPFLTNRDFGSFEDRWEGGIEHYIAWMKERMFEVHRVLKPTGSVYLHCDWHASHHLRLLLDEIFGPPMFRNEIVWHYRRWTGESRSFLKMHDTIFFYTKSKEYKFNRQFTDYTEASAKRKQNHHTRVKGDEVSVTSVDERGVGENDVWQIPLINSQARERLGYPTQKPEALLGRIILASSNEGDIVLDPFCGSGTTIVVADRLGRRAIGIDRNPEAIEITRRRLAGVQAPLLAA